MANSNPNRPVIESSRRRKVVLWLAVGLFVLFAVAVSQTAFNLKFINPDTTQQTFIFATLSALIFLLLLALTFVLGRNLLKLYAERRLGMLGSKFRTRMVLAALLLSLLPVMAQFAFAYLLLNRSIDKWFSRPVEEVREDTHAVADLLASYAAQNARAEAVAIASEPEVRRSFATGNFSAVVSEFRDHEATLQGGFALALVHGTPEASFAAPAAWPLLKKNFPIPAGTNAENFRFGNTDYIVSSAEAGEDGLIVVAMPLPAQFAETMRQISVSQSRYLELSRQRKLVRRTYLFLLGLLTMLVLFASTWLAMFVSKLVTRPVDALGEAMQEISLGHLGHRVEVSAADELADLVRSFNRMASELEGSRRQIEASSRDLADANVALEQRRRHIETILESIPTGVVSLDADLRVVHVNHAIARLFQAPSESGLEQQLLGKRIDELLSPEVIADLSSLLRRADRMGTTTTQMELPVQRRKLTVAVTVATLEHDGRRLGYVIVFEDLSDLLRAQTSAAWREVARRVAHEIKNPLTPIALSAERIRRHLEKGTSPDEASLAVIRKCTDTIEGSVETVRSLVDEFSTLARFPMAQPQPASINEIISSALGMFDGRLDAISVRCNLAQDLPKVMVDPDGMKRAIANLVDNAAEAMRDSMLREIQIRTALLPSKDTVEVVVADSGHGISQDAKEKLFLPYFSTKQRGTGLGLAIVSRIVEDHHGSIRVEENKPVGARFIIELPVAPENAPAAVIHG